VRGRSSSGAAAQFDVQIVASRGTTVADACRRAVPGLLVPGQEHRGAQQRRHRPGPVGARAEALRMRINRCRFIAQNFPHGSKGSPFQPLNPTI
jgi:hypothetical protein